MIYLFITLLCKIPEYYFFNIHQIDENRLIIVETKFDQC